MTRRPIIPLLLLTLVLLALPGVVGAHTETSMEQAYREYARQQAREVGIDESMFVAQLYAESKLDPNAVSSAGCIGIAQICPAYHPGVNPWDPWDSIRYASQLMAGYLDEFGTWDLALSAYAAGSGRVRACWCVPPFRSVHWYIASVRGGARPAGEE
jgi:soluble lytic murein transglycosylase-like protein